MYKNYVLNACEMLAADNATIEEVGIGQDVLMERAALTVVSYVRQYKPKRVLCVCGTGNNGGDALAVARILVMQGVQAEVYLCGDDDKFKLSVRKQYEIFQKVGGKTMSAMDFMEYDMIVDGIFGIGLARTVEGEYADVINEVNRVKDAGAKVIAVDIPSGINTDTGAVMGIAVKADRTVAFAYYKPGHLLYPGAEYCGEVSVEEIGISHTFINDKIIPMQFTVANIKINDILPKRPRNGNKGTFGRVLVIAGSASMYGACYLSALAALRMGAGLVDIYTHEVNRTAAQTMLPEAILHTYSDAGICEEELCKIIDASDCVVMGPGLYTDETAVHIVKTVLNYCHKTIVVDADALNCIALDKELLYGLKHFSQEREVIITPHPGEMSRLTGKSVSLLKADYIENVREFAEEYGVILVGKDAGTVVSDGRNVYINQSGNSGMATAGSGDVLSGIIGALCAQKEDAFDAAWKGVYLHGKAGDLAIEKTNDFSLIAGDIANALAEII